MAAAALTDFAVGLLREAAASSNASLILSPISIALAPSLAYAGAGGDTRREFETVFARGGIKGDALDSLFHQTFAHLTAGNRPVTLELVNRAYIAQDLHVKAAYRELLAANFGAAFQQVDFERQAGEAVAEINEFVANATHQKIRDLLSPADLNAATRMLLVNAVYFKGDWQVTFDVGSTADATFFVNKETERTRSFSLLLPVKMMKERMDANYVETDDVQVVELPFEGRETTFTVFLPKEKGGLSAWLQKVDGAELLDLMDRLEWSEVDVELPRFKVESGLKLRGMLEKLGFSEGFTERADFSGISDERLHISEGFHKALIDVSENGCEAAAATAVKFYYCTGRLDSDPVLFRADRPFAFLISHERLPLFFGRFMGPSS
ncbi:SERPIN domain-containing protein [Aphelenchoides fujianensis]|nr:SERPIN domain-containing protein [Aphelenchoides fujianensis]KAI6232834.1 SERPIN domain-containing protein [Aphelenchoides fujianensis]